MKVLNVISSVDPRGGGPIEFIRQWGAVSHRFGHDLEVVCVDAPDAPWVAGFPLPIHTLGAGWSRYGYSHRLVPWLREHARDYDCVVVHGLWQYMGLATRQALRGSGVPYFVYVHGMLDPWFKTTYPLKHLKKSLYWPLGEHRVLRDARGVLFTCEEERLLARRSFARYHCREIIAPYTVAAPGGDAEAQRQEFLQRFPDLRDASILLFLSRIHPKKGCDLLIEAFAGAARHAPRLRLVMAGPDQTGWRAKLQARARALGVSERITWAGMLSGDMKWGAFRAAEALVLPSHQENFGIVVPEALSCGTPVLISDKVNIWREIQAVGAGLVAEDTLQGTRALLAGWLELPREEKHLMRQKALSCFEERFEVQEAAQNLFAALQIPPTSRRRSPKPSKACPLSTTLGEDGTAKKTSMKILHVISSVNPVGGGPIEGVRQLGGVLQAQGHTIEIASLDAPGAPWVKECPLRVHAQGPGRGAYGYSPLLLPWLRAHARRYDALIVDGLWQYPGFATWLALRSRGCGRRGGRRMPYFVFPHGMLDPWFKRTYPLKHLKKLLYWPWAQYRVLRDATGVCFTCEEERLQARQSFSLYHCREIVVAFGTSKPPGDAQAQREAFLARFPQARGKRILLFLGRLHPKKGCDLLIEAFAGVAADDPDLCLVMAGPDQAGWKSGLEKIAQEHHVSPRIVWTGMLEGDEKWGALHAAEAFVLPSHQENFGIAVAEALACGTPVLISDKVNIWREIQADGAGLVDGDTVEGTRRLLLQWLALPEAEKKLMGSRALACFEERFEVQAAARSLLQVLVGSQELCSQEPCAQELVGKA